MTRTGKIARLPHALRDQLNRRLQDGNSGQELVHWLNSQPETQKILAADFGGRPVNEQNLSDWRKGGYEDWVRRQERCALIRSLAEESGELEEAADRGSVGDRLSAILSAELAEVSSRTFAEATESGERWKRLKEFNIELSRLRKEDNRAARLTIERERWELERANLEIEETRLLEEARERQMDQARRKALEPFLDALSRPVLEKAFGGGAEGAKLAAFFEEANRGLAPGTLTGKPSSAGKSGPAPAGRRAPSPPGSTPIKPDQGGSS